LIKTLRKKLGITQKELAILSGVTVGAAHQWETGKFTPKPEKKAALAALRRLGRSEVKKLLQAKTSEMRKAQK
jgi:transcriptional regulator with XRE-family HTH domain